MRVSDIEAINLRDGKIDFYGYFDVEVFECPPFVMFSNNDSPAARFILRDIPFEPMSTRLWCRLCHSSTGIVDIGANVGIYSLCAAALRSDIPIHAFEPNPHAFSRLRMHKGVNKFSNINELPYVVADREEYFHFSWIKKPGSPIVSGGGVGLRSNESREVESIVVKGISLDQTRLHKELGLNPLVKIDVEGSEALVVRGMSQILLLDPNIFLETFHQESCDMINDIVLPMGFNIFAISESQMFIEMKSKLSPRNVASSDFNYLITKKSESEINDLLNAQPNK